MDYIWYMDEDEFWAELNALGEDQVREYVGLGVYHDKRMDLAKEWLSQKETQRSDNKIQPWHKRSWVVALIAIIAGLCVAGLSYYLGWL